MALYVVKKDGSDVSWWVQDCPLEQHVDHLAEVDFVQADGDELEVIRQQFDGLPFHKTARVQTWHGDFAKFIIKHLR